ncbi:hemin uptake protein HemP [Stagnimonas aquatica]|uniref:Hemin uptake protein HemP n=1 Tax=Stagnimonas aquatica TaxID=2689987 RepID=A0A3N0VEJ8_9GAMM|nr:hemin uptake protein HemP [Stagnimonas aquatica]ROH91146.1 hemin uptake protein HemP [Stagnimonas aquatica]
MSTLTLPRLALPALTSRREPAKPRLRSEDLFRNNHELIIEHRGEEYRLKLTRNDKLILNK